MAAEPMKSLRHAGQGLRFRFEGVDSEDRLDQGSTRLGLRYTVSFPEDGQEKSLPVLIAVLRSRKSEGNVFWQIVRVKDPASRY
jgi:hypothetical protein